MTIQQLLDEDEMRVKIFKALAEKKRIEIIRYLLAEPSRNSCGEIGTIMNTDKSNITYHLKIMNDAGLIRVVREGQKKMIYLRDDVFQVYLPGFLDSL